MSLVKGSFILPASIVPSANKLLGSSTNYRFREPHKIGYPQGWRTGDTEAWYKSQPITRFTYLQYRKVQERPFHHEYIVIELDDRVECRFDRRGDVTSRGSVLAFDGITSGNFAEVISSRWRYYDADRNSDMILRIHFPNGQDLLTILGICYGVERDNETRAYTLTRYNCYFLSWMIVTCTARRTVDWALLCKDTNKWEDLVRATIEGLNSPAHGGQVRGNPSSLSRRERRGTAGSPSGLNSITLFSATYIINILHKALLSSRSNIQQSLEQLLFQNTVEPSIRKVSRDLAEEAAAKACQNYASRVALDAAMGAVIESMWTTVLHTGNGREVWHDRCLMTEEVVQKAASAAAKADERGKSAAKTRPENWEQAWDAAWSEGWDKVPNGRSRFDHHSFGASDGKKVSLRAKEAWKNAWIDAWEASEKFVSLLSDGVAEYVTKNLPDSSPEVLKIDIGTQPEMHALLAAMGPETKNSKLQEFIQGQIVDLCQRARVVGVFKQNPAEIEEAMRRVWVETIKVLDVDQS